MILGDFVPPTKSGQSLFRLIATLQPKGYNGREGVPYGRHSLWRGLPFEEVLVVRRVALASEMPAGRKACPPQSKEADQGSRDSRGQPRVPVRLVVRLACAQKTQPDSRRRQVLLFRLLQRLLAEACRVHPQIGLRRRQQLGNRYDAVPEEFFIIIERMLNTPINTEVLDTTAPISEIRCFPFK